MRRATLSAVYHGKHSDIFTVANQPKQPKRLSDRLDAVKVCSAFQADISGVSDWNMRQTGSHLQGLGSTGAKATTGMRRRTRE